MYAGGSEGRCVVCSIAAVSADNAVGDVYRDVKEVVLADKLCVSY